MLEHLFRKVHACYAGSPNGALLDDFASWLISAGYAQPTARRHVRRLKQALDGISSAPLGRNTGVHRAFCRKHLPPRHCKAPDALLNDFSQREACSSENLVQIRSHRFSIGTDDIYQMCVASPVRPLSSTSQRRRACSRRPCQLTRRCMRYQLLLSRGL